MHLGILDSVPGDARVDAYQDVVSTLFNLDFIIHCIVTVLLQDNYLSSFQTDLIFLPAAFYFRMKDGVERESQRHEHVHSLRALPNAPEHTGMNLAVVFIVRI
jgi:hypothetical protein